MALSMTSKLVNNRVNGASKTSQTTKNRSKIKVRITAFFDYRGVVHYEFLPEGRTINKERPDLSKANNFLDSSARQCSIVHGSCCTRFYLPYTAPLTLLRHHIPQRIWRRAFFFCYRNINYPIRCKRFESIGSAKIFAEGAALTRAYERKEIK